MEIVRASELLENLSMSFSAFGPRVEFIGSVPQFERFRVIFRGATCRRHSNTFAVNFCVRVRSNSLFEKSETQYIVVDDFRVDFRQYALQIERTSSTR